mmetsp:Transcript_9912/g.31208  ORF Transcript_9912/g.31208 Transcript_9912/m.31208 type:complete len:271 (-) Transcript_9912:896-1708(-)
MHPQTQELGHVAHPARCDHEHALEHLAQVAQVERVVALGRRRQQLRADAVVQLDGGRHHTTPDRLHLRGEAGRQERVQDGREDEVHRLILHLRVRDRVEVPEEAWRHRVPPPTRRPTRQHHHRVHHAAPRQCLAVIPPASAQPLPQQLDRRLRAVHLHLGHVQVVHEHHRVLAQRRPEHALAPLAQLAVNDVLRLVGAGLCREVDEQRLVYLRVHLVQQLVDGRHRLAGARVARQHHRLVRHQQLVHHPRHAHRVHRWHHDRLEPRVGRD